MSAAEDAARVVTTWAELKSSIYDLAAFHAEAVDACEALLAAARLQDPVALRLALTTYRDLEAPDHFKIDKVLFERVN